MYYYNLFSFFTIYIYIAPSVGTSDGARERYKYIYELFCFICIYIYICDLLEWQASQTTHHFCCACFFGGLPFRLLQVPRMSLLHWNLSSGWLPSQELTYQIYPIQKAVGKMSFLFFHWWDMLVPCRVLRD